MFILLLEWLLIIFTMKFHVRDSQNACDQITSDRRSKHAGLKCVLCIPFILSGSPNECWLHTLCMYMQCMLDNNLEIWMVDSSCHLQLNVIVIFLDFTRLEQGLPWLILGHMALTKIKCILIMIDLSNCTPLGIHYNM